MLKRARELRKNMTKQERHLWYDYLRSYPVKFYKQRVIGNYIADFYCDKASLVVELDGSQHYEDETVKYDTLRTEYLEINNGLQVVRFTNTQVNKQFRAVCVMIDFIVKKRLGLVKD
ncbi:MAG: endonuclease domain-containing protein [Eubacterium sp.]|nr:endonuclease domain-containing protein [Eubacterium sp.]